MCALSAKLSLDLASGIQESGVWVPSEGGGADISSYATSYGDSGQFQSVKSYHMQWTGNSQLPSHEHFRVGVTGRTLY